MLVVLTLLQLFHLATQNVNPCGQLFLTQSPNKKKNVQLNWNFSCEDPPDKIILTSSDIKNNTDVPILHEIEPKSVYKGYHEVQYSLKDVAFPGNWTLESQNPDLQANCFNLYIASLRKNEVVHSQCLGIQPSWMSRFGELRIGELMIPGTHNSGAYKGGPSLIKSYVLNQDRSFYEQLVYGIRFFDIRVGRYSDGLYINHAFIKCTELLPELEGAATFLKQSPQEVIILNFHRFPQPKTFSRNNHLEVISAVRAIFGDLIYPFYKIANMKGPKLKDFWFNQQRVIVSYRDKDMIREFSWLWPPVRRFWGNKQKVTDLEGYVNSVLSLPAAGNPMHVLMAELTPNYYSVLKHVTRNLKDLAVLVNRELSDWVRGNNGSSYLNIIATDFFTGNDIINVAIEANLQKLRP